MEPDNYKNFINQLRTGTYRVNYYYENTQPEYYSKPVTKDPVQEELNRQDALENVLEIVSTQWVVDYCKTLQTK